MMLYDFILEFPSEKDTIFYQVKFLFKEIHEWMEAVIRRDWVEVNLEAQQVIQCIAYLLFKLRIPKFVINSLTPLQKEYMALALSRAQIWDKVRSEIEMQGFEWRLPGRCSRSLSHFAEIMTRNYPEIPAARWGTLINLKASDNVENSCPE